MDRDKQMINGSDVVGDVSPLWAMVLVESFKVHAVLNTILATWKQF